MRAYEKKKLYKKMCRDQVKNGRINDQNGTWIPYKDTGTYGAMHRDMRSGYKIR